MENIDQVKRKIITSMIAILLLILTLFGITYAYFTARVKGNTNDESVNVTAGRLELVYGDGNGEIKIEKVHPGVVLKSKTFTVTNKGTHPVENYLVILENVINELERKEDLVYKLECSSSDNNECSGIEETIFPKSETIVTSNRIEIGVTHSYTLTLEYKEAGIDQSIDMNKLVEGKVNIADLYEYNPYKNNTNSLTYNIVNNAITNKNGTTIAYPKKFFTGMNDENEKTLSIAEDDYGISYYYRGNVIDNYVNFAGFTWRIVRINGDGSVRLILDGITSKVKTEGESNYAGTNTAFNTSYDENAYVGYMYGTPGSATYDVEHDNVNDSKMKDNVDLFYETYLKDNYSFYLADTLFCGDKSLASSTIGNSNTALGYEKNKTYYAASERLYYSTAANPITNANPSLKCANGELNDYSRYTVEAYTTPSGEQTNGDLTYPIALLSVDELVMAGAFRALLNVNYYLYDINTIATSWWWTMTPYSFNGSKAYNFYSIKTTSAGINNVDNEFGIRPVINLKSNVIINSGDGTKNNPFHVTIIGHSGVGIN